MTESPDADVDLAVIKCVMGKLIVYPRWCLSPFIQGVWTSKDETVMTCAQDRNSLIYPIKPFNF